MKRKLVIGLLLVSLIAVPLFATACEDEEPPPAQQEEEEEQPQVEEPQYGGTITTAVESFTQIDAYRSDSLSCLALSNVYDYLIGENLLVDREVFNFPSSYGDTTMAGAAGMLAESWEIKDDYTFILHIRNGVHFQNLPPVNGRELTADDIIWNYQRYKDDPFSTTKWLDEITSMTAIDPWTIEFKLQCLTSLGNLTNIFIWADHPIIAPESVDPSTGEIVDWKKCIGTGPFMITDYVPDSMLYFERNPDYWGYDPRYPENRLPYADESRVAIISDYSTCLAAFRTGQLDQKFDISYEDAQSLLETNPEIKYTTKLKMMGVIFNMKQDSPPFNDIRVRQALQMAVDLKTLQENYFHGAALYYTNLIRPGYDPTYYRTYDELPDEPLFEGDTYSIKQLLTYNPSESRELLAEAAADGVFEPNDLGGFDTSILATNMPSMQPGLVEALQSYLADVGIRLEINMYDQDTFLPLMRGKEFDGLVHSIIVMYPDPVRTGLYYYTGYPVNCSSVSDPVFDAWYDQAFNTADPAEQHELVSKMNDYALEKVFYITMPDVQAYFMWQPWLKGYNGEGFRLGTIAKTAWVDQIIKASMGH
jgi:peptide/nickel transport system substrate-binding protein